MEQPRGGDLPTGAGLDLEQSRLTGWARQALADDSTALELDELLATVTVALDVPHALLRVADADHPWIAARVPWTDAMRQAADAVAQNLLDGVPAGSGANGTSASGAGPNVALAGVPVHHPDGRVAAALVVASEGSLGLDDRAQAALRAFARHVQTVLDLRASRRKLAHQALSAARRTAAVRAFVDHCPVPLSLRDPQGRYLLATPSAAELDEQGPLTGAEAQAMTRNRAITSDDARTDARGRQREFVTTAFPLPAGDGTLAVASVSVEITGLARTRQRLARDEADFRALAETSAAAVYVLDTAGHVRWTNPAATVWRGGAVGELPDDRSGLDSIAPEGMEWMLQHVGDGTAARLPGRWWGRAAPATVSVAVHRLTWHGDEALAVEAIDAAVLGRAEAALSRAQARLTDLFDLAPVPAAQVDHERRIVAANPALERLMKVGRGQLTGRSIASLLTPECAERAARFAAEMADGQRCDVRTEATVLTAEGEQRHCLLHSIQVPGSPAHGCVQIVDLTQAHERDERGRAQADLLDHALHLTQVGWWRRGDGDGPVTWSPFMKDLLRLPEDVEPTRELWAELVEPADLPRLAEAMAGDDDEKGPLDLRVRRWDGVRRVFEVRARRLVPGSGAAGAVVGVIRDVTDERAAADGLAASADWLRQLFEAAPDALVVVSADGRIAHANRQASQLFGWDGEHLVGRPIEMLVPGHLHTVHRRHRAAAALGDQPRVMHAHEYVEAVTSSGGRVPVEITLSRVQLDGEPAVLASVRDVSATRALQRQVQVSRDALLEVLDGAQEQAIIALDERGRIGEVFSAGAAALLHLDPAEAVGRRLADLVDPAELAEAARAAGTADPAEALLVGVRDRGQDTAAWTLRRPDGTSTRISLSLTRRPSREGAPAGFIAVGVDVQEATEARLELAASEARFRTAFRHAPVPMLVVSLDDADAGHLRYVNDALSRLLDREPDDLVGHHVNEFTHPDDRQAGADLVRMQRRGQVEHWELEKRYLRPDGSPVWVHLTGSTVPDAGGRPDQVIVQVEDISERRDVEADLAHRALHDALTSLPNADLMREHLTGALARARRTQCPVGVLLVDLDDFKLVNDSLGVDAGDRVLVTVAERLRLALRDVDFVARAGGDEFVVIAENLPDVADVEHLADRVLAAVHEPVELSGHTVTLSASVGMALSAPGAAAADVVAEAESAMYGAKAAGKSRWSQADKTRRDTALRQITLEHQLRAALESEQLFLVYQPVVDLTSSSVVAVEALVRWRHPQRGVLGPDQFLDVAEARDLIRPLGAWVLRTACVQAAAWASAFGERAPAMWVNVSARQLGSAQLHREVRRCLGETGLPGTWLHIELTERQLVDLGPSVRSDLRQLRDLGVGLAIDDWGTGHNGIEHLRQLPVTALKIDKSFTAGLGHDRTDTALTASIVALGRELELTVVAEGIETAEQLATLRHFGADLGQGYHFFRPVEADAVPEIVAVQARSEDLGNEPLSR